MRLNLAATVMILIYSSNVFSKSQLSFSYFLKEMVSRNNTYLGAFLSEEAALYRKEGTLGYYAPTLNIAQSEAWSKTNGDPTSLVKTTSSGLQGRVPQLGLGYSSTIYSNQDTLKPAPRTRLGLLNFSLTLDLLKNFGPRVGWIPFDQADLAYDISRLNRAKSVYSLFQDLLSAYLTTYITQKNLDINLDSQKRNEEELKKSQALYNSGRIPRLSLLSLNSQSLQIKSQVLSQERTLRDAFANLYTASSIDIDRESVPISYHNKLEALKTPFFDELIIEELVSKKIDFESLRNIDFLLAKKQLDQAKLGVKLAENDVWPSLALSYTISGQGNRPSAYENLYPRTTDGNTIALSFSMPLGFFTERAELQARNKEFRFTDLTFIQLKRRLARDWENLRQQYSLLKEQQKISKELTAAAKDKYLSSLSSASLGPTYQANVILFQNDWINTQINLNQLENEVLNTQIKILSFHAHKHLNQMIYRLAKQTN